ncbi:PAS domain-containing sensor histidine kinase [Caballeronia sp. EK]|uniref:histidine kinase dimerization/phospho-acceptor domain-containing protein n=1 Tax=Caballeronia sp. EK TaxID=2767469 RepID=UPI001654F35B|nr:histidine kinase dimerization/phospho-acceptor domain-containing protein [Caballeronia sp. EK]MBC8642576.1 PAS domain-containing sensor histidine kinase [Caballeronia sp. EK]
MFLPLNEAIRQARQDGVAVRKTGLRTGGLGGLQATSVEVHPLRPAGIDGRWLLIFFESAGPSDGLGAPRQDTFKDLIAQTLRQRLGRRIAAAQGADPRDEEIIRLNAEIGAMRTQLRTMLEEHESAREELKSSEEELLSSNEEFQSTNEELETAKEELQSLNEELLTTNDELRYRNQELKTLHDDMVRARDYADGIIDTMSEPLLVLKPDLRVTRANRAFYQTFHTAPEVTIGTLLYALGNGQWNIPRLRELLETILPQQTVVRDFEITHSFPTIGPRTMRLSAARVIGRELDLIVLTVEDITLHQRAVERMELADRQKDEFLAMLAHELRNPLAAIRTGLEIWGRENVDEQTQALARTAAKRQLDHEVGLVDDLLDVSRITRGIIRLTLAPIDFAQVVQQGVAVLRADNDARRHELTLALIPQDVIVEGDAMRLEQIVTNLVGNAIKYTPCGGPRGDAPSSLRRILAVGRMIVVVGKDPTDQIVILGRLCFHDSSEHLDESVAVLQVFHNHPSCAQRYRLRKWRSSTVVQQKFESVNLHRRLRRRALVGNYCCFQFIRPSRVQASYARHPSTRRLQR